MLRVSCPAMCLKWSAKAWPESGLTPAGFTRALWELAFLPWRPDSRPFSSLMYISISAVTAADGFALTASPFCQTPQKEPKRLAPSVRPLAWARRSFAPVSIRGHCPPVGFASAYMQRVRLRRTALRATPRMNTSTQPPEGAGESKAKDQKLSVELTLGLLSGEKQGRYTNLL